MSVLRIFVLILSLATAAASAAPAAASISLADFGGDASGKADSGPALRNALQDVVTRGAGELVVPPGQWRLAEPVMIEHPVTIRLEHEAAILGALRFRGANGIRLVGAGMERSSVTDARFEDCQRIEVRDVGGERQWYTRCSDVRLDRVSLHQRPQRQGEGSAIGFTWCRDVWVAESDFSSNDDVFCLKRAGENIHLTRSRLRGHLAAPFKIGTETDGVFRDISFTDSVVVDSDRAAITLEAVDGATIENVRCERLQLINVNTPLFIRLGNRDRYSLQRIGRIRGIVLRDIESTGGGKDEGFGSAISGLPGHPVEDVLLERVRILVRGGGRPEEAEDPVPERAEFYPEFDMFGKLPAFALYLRHARGVTLRDVSLGFATPDLRSALVCDEVENLVLDGLKPMGVGESVSVIREVEGRRRYQPGRTLPAGAASVRLIDTRNIWVQGCRAAPGVSFLELGGERSGGMVLGWNDFSAAGAPALVAGPEVSGTLPEPFVRGSVRVPRRPESAPALPNGDVSWLVAAVARAREGETIAIPRGHYRVPGDQLPLVVKAKGVRLRPAAGAGSVRIEAVPHPHEDVQRIYRTGTPDVLGGFALLRVAADDVVIEDLTLGGAAFNVFAAGVHRLTVRGNTFDFSRCFHLYLLDGSGHQLIANRARASLNCVARLDRCTGALLERNNFAENPAGFRLLGSTRNTIRHNRLIGLSWDAILLDEGSNDNLVEENEIVGGRLTGVQIRGAHRNRLVGNRLAEHKNEAVLIDRGAAENVIHHNDFHGNVGYAVSNETPHRVDARENWWGTPDGPGRGTGLGEMVDARVDFSPWLTAPPPLPSLGPPPGDGWISIFNGRDLSGWRANLMPESFQVVDGILRVQATAPSAHLFFAGDRDEGAEILKDFELEVLVRSEPGSNSGIYFHSAFDSAQGRQHHLSKGHEVQLNSSSIETRKTGSLYSVVDLDVSPVDEMQWFRLRVKVQGRQITIAVNGRPVVEYTEPVDVKRPAERAGKRIDPAGGAIALQAHDPKSVFYFKEIWLRRL